MNPTQPVSTGDLRTWGSRLVGIRTTSDLTTNGAPSAWAGCETDGGEVPIDGHPKASWSNVKRAEVTLPAVGQPGRNQVDVEVLVQKNAHRSRDRRGCPTAKSNDGTRTPVGGLDRGDLDVQVAHVNRAAGGAVADGAVHDRGQMTPDANGAAGAIGIGIGIGIGIVPTPCNDCVLALPAESPSGGHHRHHAKGDLLHRGAGDHDLGDAPGVDVEPGRGGGGNRQR